ncbi:MAG: FecR domain-containing protein [Magnetococcales bacterium]|nr:FecR domain-containing protein [Magnetococcales bacterium]
MMATVTPWKQVIRAVLCLGILFGVTRSYAEEALKEGGIPEGATIIKVMGQVHVRPLDQPEWQEATVGMVLKAGSRVETKDDGKATLEFYDHSLLALGEATRLNLAVDAAKNAAVNDDAVNDASQRAFSAHVFEGVVRAFVAAQKDKQAFQLRTPTAIIGVRGTEFLVNAVFGTTTVIQIEGGVHVNEGEQSGEGVLLGPGEMTANTRGRMPMVPVSLKENPGLEEIRTKLQTFTDSDVPADIKAREAFREILSRWYISYASLLTDQKRYEDAETALLIAHNLSYLDNVKSETLLHVANIHARFRNDPKSAFLYLQRIMRDFKDTPKYESALFQMAMVMNAMNEEERSKAFLVRYATEFPEGVHISSVKTLLWGQK